MPDLGLASETAGIHIENTLMKKKVWGQSWTDEYYIATLGGHENKQVINMPYENT